MEFVSFRTVVDDNATKPNMQAAIKFLEDNKATAIKDSASVQRLLNRCAYLNQLDDLEKVLEILIKNHFFFDNIEYCYSVKPLINSGQVGYALTVVRSLIENEIAVDMATIQRLLEVTMEQKHFESAMQIVLLLA